ncbi:aldo/keto reductase [Caldimonas tepidiphila]|uniref:aldo/keto reductase n=1 Tax=Caldimonas tepidiphila TaxID=2315841 RepID=UPI000E5BA474|nr:aldo/keto reductase [Caldimonas tepidiphila]
MTIPASFRPLPDGRPESPARAVLLRGCAAAVGAALLPGPAAGRSTTERTTMQQRRIPSSGRLLPVIGCGTWQTFDVGRDAAAQAQRAEVLRVLFESGGSVIDSSPMYGSSEEVVGTLLAAAGSRERAFLATKVWTRGREAGIAQMERSMALLRTPHIELMQIHNLVNWRAHLPTLRAWKREGRIGHLGITHYTPSAHDELAALIESEPLDFVQLDYAINDRAAEARLLPLAAGRGVAVLVNQPFGGGGLLRSLLGRPLPAWAGGIGCTSWAQLLLKFVLSHPAVTCVIPGTARPEHMRENALAGSGEIPERAFWQPRLASLGF